MGKKENNYQSGLIKRIKERFPGCMVLKNDPNYIQGVPDLTIFHKQHWATLEVKKDSKAEHQPNQDHYVEKMNNMSYSAFIFPENEEDILNEIQNTFES